MATLLEVELGSFYGSEGFVESEGVTADEFNNDPLLAANLLRRFKGEPVSIPRHDRLLQPVGSAVLNAGGVNLSAA